MEQLAFWDQIGEIETLDGCKIKVKMYQVKHLIELLDLFITNEGSVEYIEYEKQDLHERQINGLIELKAKLEHLMQQAYDKYKCLNTALGQL